MNRSSHWIRQFSLRTLLLAVLVSALTVVGWQRYLAYRADYVWPSDATLSEFWRPTDFEKFVRLGSDTLTAKLRTQHPPKGLQHWQLELQNLQPGMTEFALIHCIPPAALTQRASVQGLGVHSDLLMCYAVDSKHGIVVEMSCNEFTTLSGKTFSLARVERPIGVFEHDGVLTDFNTLPISFCRSLTLADLVAP